MSESGPSRSLTLPYAVMVLTPLFFSTNIIFGRYVADETAPFVLAFLRWAAVAAILMPWALWHDRPALTATLRRHWRLLAGLGVLGMGISGGGVYWGLEMTTATNATLIYSTAPVLIILLERVFRGRAIAGREAFGMALAFLGVGWIILRGDPSTLAKLSLNPGDLLIALAALSWAAYSILYRNEALSRLDNLSLFGLIACFGALANLPFAMIDLARGDGLPATPAAWQATAGIVVIASLMAFSGFQFGVRALGASLAGLFMYLMTPYGVLLAIVFLGERLEPFHGPGIAAVLIGIAVATFPKTVLAKFRR